VPDQKLVERPQRAESQLNRRAAQILPAEETANSRGNRHVCNFFPRWALSRRSGFIREGGTAAVAPRDASEQIPANACR